MRNRIDFKSFFQGFSCSRLPYFTDKEVQLIKDAADFFEINFYREFKIRTAEVWKEEMLSFKHDVDFAFLSENESICNTRVEVKSYGLLRKIRGIHHTSHILCVKIISFYMI